MNGWMDVLRGWVWGVWLEGCFGGWVLREWLGGYFKRGWVLGE